jgi:hypothetical protein
MYKVFWSTIDGDISVGTVVGRLKWVEAMGAGYRREIKFLASYFREISSPHLAELGFDIL